MPVNLWPHEDVNQSVMRWTAGFSEPMLTWVSLLPHTTTKCMCKCANKWQQGSWTIWSVADLSASRFSCLTDPPTPKPIILRWADRFKHIEKNLYSARLCGARLSDSNKIIAIYLNDEKWEHYAATDTMILWCIIVVSMKCHVSASL